MDDFIVPLALGVALFLVGMYAGVRIGMSSGEYYGAKKHFKGEIVCVEIAELNKIECGEPK